MKKRKWMTCLLAAAVACAIVPSAAFASETTKGADDAVAEVGGKYYTTLLEAVESGEESQTINLLKDYTVATDNFKTYALPDSSVLDLGTHTLATTYDNAPAFEGDGVTIQNGSITSTGNYIYIGNGGSYATVTLKNVKTDAGLNVFASDVTLEDCYVDASTAKYYALWADEGAPATIIVKSGTYISGKTALVGTWKEQGKLEIEGGKFIFSGAFVPGSKGDYDNVSVSGGTFTSEVPSGYIAEGHEQAKQSDGTYLVGKHELKKTDAVASTCKDHGHEAYWTCGTCGKMYSDAAGATEIAAPVEFPLSTEHKFGNWTITAKPTEDSKGEKTRTCSVCGKTETESIPAITSSAKQKVETVELTDETISDDLKDAGMDSAEKIESALTDVAVKNEGYTAENTAVSNVKLMISTDGGETWFEATEENFPEEGITVTLAYPEGTDASYDFVVAHMFGITSSKLGTKAGNVETPTVQKTKDGIKVTLKGLSPVSISWKKSATVTPSDPTTPTTPATPTTPNTAAKISTTTTVKTVVAAQLPKTGDATRNVVAGIALIGMGIAAAGAIARNRKQHMN